MLSGGCLQAKLNHFQKLANCTLFEGKTQSDKTRSEIEACEYASQILNFEYYETLNGANDCWILKARTVYVGGWLIRAGFLELLFKEP